MGKLFSYGVGYSSDGRHVKTVNRKPTKLYSTWLNMLKRCYCEKVLDRCPTYKGCSVSDSFKDFQLFADWAESQVGVMSPQWQLDKDLLVRGNKIYSEQTCVFLPPQLNSLLINCKASRGNTPVGVWWDEDRRLYQVYLTVHRKRVHLGRYSSETEAFNMYKKEKESHIRSMAKEWKDIIDPRAYNALMNYGVLITD